MDKIQLTEHLWLSPIIHGHMRINDWNLSPQGLLSLTNQLVEKGISSFDHANIYDNYTCEKHFGDALRMQPGLRSQIEIITKCGIELVSEKYPDRKLKIYDYRYENIMTSVEQSLKNLNTDSIDLLLLHRPAPFWNPAEISKAFDHLFRDGKVTHFGVSNFTKDQFETLQQFCNHSLVTNQLEISPYCLEHFDNGNLDFCLKHKIKPMAWSPLSGSEIFHPRTAKGIRLVPVLEKIKDEISAKGIDGVIYAWLLKHPTQILPIVGSGNLDRIQVAIDAFTLDMNLEQWYEIYNASKGVELP